MQPNPLRGRYFKDAMNLISAFRCVQLFQIVSRDETRVQSELPEACEHTEGTGGEL